MTAQSNFPLNDLILRLAGGQRDGELIPVNTQKCFLGFDETAEQGAEQSQCAIFRGPNGTAVRSYGDNLSVNGVASTVHWLKEGDRIEFPNSITVEIAQLGWVETSCQEHDVASDEDPDSVLRRFPNDNGSHQQAAETEFVGQQEETEFVDQPAETEAQYVDQQQIEAEYVDQQEAETEYVDQQHVEAGYVDQQEAGSEHDDRPEIEPQCMDQPEADPEVFFYEHPPIVENQSPNQNELRFEQVESQLKDIQSQVSQSDQRFDRLDHQLTVLSERVSELLSISNDRPAHPGHAEELFITNSTVEQPNELAPSEEVIMHQGSTEPTELPLDDESADIRSAGNFYSHLDDDDEKIIRFDPESEADCGEALTDNVEVVDELPELSNDVQNEIDSRLSEMERVFGGVLAEPDSDTTEPAIEQTADEEGPESFESPTHGLNEGSDSFADYPTTDVSESLKPGSLASQLLSDVLADTEPVDELPAEEVSEEPVDVAEPASEPAPSVAELLARMKAEGQWDGVPDGDDNDEPVTQPVVESPVESTTSAEPEGDVEDYMSQLLNRMRGGEPEAEVDVEPVEGESESDNPETETVSPEVDFVTPDNPLSPDEFKPARKAPKIELSAMRELANSTSRSAVHASESTRRKELGYLQIGIAVASFFMSIYYFFVSSKSLMDTGSLVGLVCLGIAGFLGFRFYSNLRENELLEAVTQEKSTDKPDEVGEPDELETLGTPAAE